MPLFHQLYTELEPTCIFLNTTVSDLGCLEHVKTSQISTALMYCNSETPINLSSLQDVNEIRRDTEIPMIRGQNLVHVKNDDRRRSLTSRTTKPVKGYSRYCSREPVLLAPLYYVPFRPRKACARTWGALFVRLYIKIKSIQGRLTSPT